MGASWGGGGGPFFGSFRGSGSLDQSTCLKGLEGLGFRVAGFGVSM